MNARRIVRTVLALAVLAAGIMAFKGLTATKKKASRSDDGDRRTLVEAIEVQAISQAARIEASGVVLPSRQVLLAAEVGGRVVQMNPKLVPGGRVAAKERLLRIDSRDYQLAMAQQAAQVDRAKTELVLERGRKRIAEREWDLLGGKPAAPGPGAGTGAGQALTEVPENLALREPQIRSAKAALQAAESGLELARLAVGKTSLSVSFNALVQQRNVDVGQLVGPGAPLATLVGTDSFWIQVAIPVGKLAWIDIPGYRNAATGSTAIVRQHTGDGTIERTGQIIRLMADLDPAGRMARVLVEIQDPLGLKDPDKNGAPLLVGAYVEVDIEGRHLENVIKVPRLALRENGTVFMVDDNHELLIQPIDIAWRQRDYVLVQKGLKEGDKLIITPMGAPLEGMKLKLVGAKQPAAEPAKPATAAGHNQGPKGAAQK